MRRIALVAITAGVLALPVSAGAEPKNQWPFTRPANPRTLSAAVLQPAVQVHGESKNQLPFTRVVGGRAVSNAVIAGQPAGTPVGGTDWRDLGLGAVAGLALAAAGLVFTRLGRHAVREQTA
jgi:hypothetical protein